MSLSKTDVDQVVARSANLTERLRREFVPTGKEDKISQRRLSHWKSLVEKNSPGELAKIASAHGYNLSDDTGLLTMLGPISCRPELPSPTWASLLIEISESVARSPIAMGGEISDELKGSSHSIPYVHLFEPICEFASRLAFDSEPQASSWLCLSARRGLASYLMRRISSILSRALHLSFLAQQAFYQSRVAPFSQKTATGEARSGYLRFVRDHSQDGLRTIFLRYPVAARLVAEMIQQWINLVREFSDRWKNDKEAVAFLLGVEPAVMGKITAIKAGVSDPHHGGRSVMILTFQDRSRVVYKPRSMKIDAAFFEFVAEINRWHRTPDLRVMKILARDDYGWMEFAHHAPCHDRRAAKRFYRRSGALAYLLHWLQGIDFHRENMVASGEYPVVIDLEALAHPIRLEEQAPRDPHSLGCLAESVLRTGLLPLRQTPFDDSTPYDESALGAPIIQRGLFRSAQWKNVNTDAMRLEFEMRSHSHAGHRPSLGNRTLSLKNYESDVLGGYQQMAALLRDAGDEFRAWRVAIFSTNRRRITKPTMAYGMLVQRSLQPEFLTDGVDRSIELYALPCGSGDEGEWAEEIASLEKLDIPYFSTHAQSSSHAVSDLHATPSQMSILRQSIRGELILEGAQIRRKTQAAMLAAGTLDRG